MNRYLVCIVICCTVMFFGSCENDSKKEKNNILAADTEPPLPDGWNHQAYLKSSNNSDNDIFGYAVACDGDTVVIGAYEEDSNTTSIIHGIDLYFTNDLSWTNGAVYVYRRSGTTWVQEAYLKAPNAGGGDQFGYSVAISGNTIVVGAPGEDSSTTAIINGIDLSSTNNSVESTGAVYVFVRDANNMWSHQAYLKPPASNSMQNDNFGYSVDIHGDTIIVGAPYEDSQTSDIINGSTLGLPADTGTNINTGAAYVFVRSGTSWSHQAYLKATNAGDGDNFGMSVAASGESAVVGAAREDSASGAAYVFVRSGIAWSHQAYLKAPNAGGNDYFGQSVAIDGETVVVGAMYEDSGTTAIINGDNLTFTNNDVLNSGAAYVFVRSGTIWSHQAYLKAPVPASTNTNNAYTNANDEFGYSVSISGDRIIVGAHYEDSSTGAIINGSDLTGINEYGNQNGAAYVFGRSESTWTMEGYLKAPNSTQQDDFGNAVGISGDTIIVGARYEDSLGKSVINGTDLSAAINDGSQNGSAYIYYYNAAE